MWVHRMKAKGWEFHPYMEFGLYSEDGDLIQQLFGHLNPFFMYIGLHSLSGALPTVIYFVLSKKNEKLHLLVYVCVWCVYTTAHVW